MSNSTTVKTESPIGFKETKLGWIPEDWEVTYLKKVCDKIQDGNYGGSYPKKEEFLVTGIPFLTSKALGGDGVIKGNKIDYISKIKHKELKKAHLKLNDILFTNRGANVGVIGIVDEKIENGNIGPQLTLLRSNSLVDNYFLKHILQSFIVQNQILSQDTGSAMNFFGIGTTSKFKIILPPLPEQKAIANCLNTWDTAITKLDALIKAKQQLKKALMQQLLSGKKRLPGFEGEWEEFIFSDITERINRKNVEADDTVVTISAQRGFILQEDYFNKRVASDTLINYTLVHNGEYCYNKSYSKGYPMGAFKRLDDFEKAVVTTLYICFSLKENVDSDFLNQYFGAGKMIPGLMRIAQEGGRAHGLLNISLPDFFRLPVTIPMLEEQTAIAQVLNTADQEIELLTSQRNQLQLQKKGLMQQLLTGKKRLKI
jgi:type I restriction enzyme S subunit